MSRIVNLALVGAGNRGRGIFGQYALDMPHRARFTHVAEPDEAKRKQFMTQHNSPAAQAYADYHELFATDLTGLDGVVIARSRCAPNPCCSP